MAQQDYLAKCFQEVEDRRGVFDAALYSVARSTFLFVVAKLDGEEDDLLSGGNPNHINFTTPRMQQENSDVESDGSAGSSAEIEGSDNDDQDDLDEDDVESGEA